ncbi:2-deoxyribose-5-phosphate aldolase [Chryseobacterium sp. Leaf180]|uniref:deoxyribose-phosphate aldolase n=1 Tax=Chryseobacterium sp. Leaf180 TaxID=1736289 RepID=UPI0006F85670|nr:deoxyribose-phosphate aldolase [Chryseobacterium sp. Leaf180]KQR91937.1 2-deoxyribose-5-phosphate aldolase [Chryseobacterium sp. Leaf180]
MKDIAAYLDSTYLKTSAQSGLSQEETWQKVKNLIDEAVLHKIFAVMIRPEFVSDVKKYLNEKGRKVVIGTVIGFHEGYGSVEEKLAEAKNAIEAGADELDFVINYHEYLKGNISYIENEFQQCTELCLQNKKIAKWIIEIAALNNTQIAELTSKISGWATQFFAGKEENIFVKSSTGFYETENGKPNGATFEGIKIMLDNAGKIPVKAAGGVRTPDDAEKMIDLGVKRIGTSSALSLISDKDSSATY